jgi:hypothetical protein
VAALLFITAPSHLFAVYLLMAVGWATMSVGAITNILGLWFEAKRGLAISLALNGASFSGVVIVPGLVFLTGVIGFEPAMLTGAALILLAMVPLTVRVLASPGASAHGDTRPNPGAGSGGARWTRPPCAQPPVLERVKPFSLSLMSQAGFPCT